MKKEEMEKKNEENNKEGAENSNVSEKQCYGTKWGEKSSPQDDRNEEKSLVFLQFQAGPPNKKEGEKKKKKVPTVSTVTRRSQRLNVPQQADTAEEKRGEDMVPENVSSRTLAQKSSQNSDFSFL